MSATPHPLKSYDSLKTEMDKGGISPVYHTPYILEFLLQRERITDARLSAIEKHLKINVKVLNNGKGKIREC